MTKLFFLSLGILLSIGCSYTPSLKITLTNKSDRTIADVRLGHNSDAESILIPKLEAGKQQDLTLSFKTAKKEDGRYWISTGDGLIDSFAFYKNGLPVHTWIGITHHGNHIEVSMQ